MSSGEPLVARRRRDEARDDLRIERGAAAGDALGRLEEVGDLEDAVLEQVAEAAERHEVDRVAGLDVLGEQEHAELRGAGP